MTIKVCLDTTARPPVTCDPVIKIKERGANDVITWERDAGDQFDFVSVTFARNPGCFGTPKVTKDKITVSDNNSGGTSVGDFPYTVVVTAGGKNYSSAGGGIAGGGSDPTIQNK